MIALIDYGAGDLAPLKAALAAAGADLFVPGAPADLEPASAIVVPGAGPYSATQALAGDWTDAILARVGEGRPLLGLGLGMQWLFEGSEEAPDVPGLGVIGGQVRRLREHFGWNTLAIGRDAAIVSGIADGSRVYFAHRFAAPVTSETVAITEHDWPFASIVQRGQIAGVQFSPEDSGRAGLQILRNFVESSR